MAKATLEDFDPNQLPSKSWAVFAECRSPQFRIYSGRGPALTAWLSWPSSILYRREDSAWVEVFRKAVRDYKRCDVCLGEEFRVRPYLSRRGAKIAEPLAFSMMCHECARARGV